jgi:hypothetical protein
MSNTVSAVVRTNFLFMVGVAVRPVPRVRVAHPSARNTPHWIRATPPFAISILRVPTCTFCHRVGQPERAPNRQESDSGVDIPG